MKRRFVVLLHESPRGNHWDLMLETGETLTTWALPPQAEVGMAFSCQAEPLPDHRLAYLDYEGPVSHNRGTVRRLDRGEYVPLEPGRYRLDGSLMKGILETESVGEVVSIRFTPFLCSKTINYSPLPPGEG